MYGLVFMAFAMCMYLAYNFDKLEQRVKILEGKDNGSIDPTVSDDN